MRDRASRDASRRASRQPRDELGRFCEVAADPKKERTPKAPKTPKARRSCREPTVRDEDEPVLWDGSGDRERVRDLDRRMSGAGRYVGTRTVTVKVGSEEYEIPTDVDGYVLWEDLIRRFCEVEEGGKEGTLRNPSVDMAVDATKVIELGRKIRPEQIAEWWAHPNMLDIAGIDDASHESFSSAGTVRKGALPYTSKVAKIHMSPKQIELVNKTLSESFTVGELKTITSGSYPMIIAEDFGPNAAGKYGADGTTIKLAPGVGINPVTITHEANHMLKHKDTTREGVVTRSHLEEYRQTRDERYRNLEEAENTLETLARITPYEVAKSRKSYYARLTTNKDKMDSNMDHDRKLITGSSDPQSKGIRGKKLVDSIEKNFDKTEISNLKHPDPKTSKKKKTEPAISTARDLGWKSKSE